MANQPVRMIQLSDIHLFADSSRDLLGVPTKQSFQAVLAAIQQEKRPIDFFLLSGDLSQDCSAETYLNVAQALQPFKVPVYYTLGNHDDPKAIANVFPVDPILEQKNIVLKNWQIILLSSHKPDAVEGFLDAKQLNFLEQCLQAQPNLRAVIVFHHQPVPVGTVWLDKLGLTNAKEFWQIVAKYPLIHTVLFGHVHQAFATVHQGIHCYSVPSTCIQFKPNQVDFALDKIPPGYRYIELHDDGELTTSVVRVANYVGHFDENAKGY